MIMADWSGLTIKSWIDGKQTSHHIHSLLVNSATYDKDNDVTVVKGYMSDSISVTGDVADEIMQAANASLELMRVNNETKDAMAKTLIDYALMRSKILRLEEEVSWLKNYIKLLDLPDYLLPYYTHLGEQKKMTDYKIEYHDQLPHVIRGPVYGYANLNKEEEDE